MHCAICCVLLWSHQHLATMDYQYTTVEVEEKPLSMAPSPKTRGVYNESHLLNKPGEKARIFEHSLSSFAASRTTPTAGRCSQRRCPACLSRHTAKRPKDSPCANFVADIQCMSPVVPEGRHEIHAPMHHDHERPLESSGSRRIERRPPTREMVADELFIRVFVEQERRCVRWLAGRENIQARGKLAKGLYSTYQILF